MQNFRIILFAADFSPNSKEAFRVACSLAIENSTRVIVLHVVEPSWVPDDPVYFGQAVVHFHGAARDEAHHQALKQKLREVYTPAHPIDMEYETREGNASEEILGMADEIGSDLIVMGTHGRSGMRWLLAGSVAIAVLRGARCPVVALRSAELPREAEEIRAILHATDFSASSESAAWMARSLARDLGARLIILHVAPLEVLMDGTPVAAIDPQVYGDALENLRNRLDGPDLKYPVETQLSRGLAPEGILQTAKELGCDLIVMGSHGRTGLSRVLMGSVAEFVMPKSNCPVMVVKASQWVPASTSDQPAAKMMIVI